MFSRGTRQGGTVAERKTIIDRTDALPVVRQARELADQPRWRLLLATSRL
jgi:hypothetical protein